MPLSISPYHSIRPSIRPSLPNANRLTFQGRSTPPLQTQETEATEAGPSGSGSTMTGQPPDNSSPSIHNIALGEILATNGEQDHSAAQEAPRSALVVVLQPDQADSVTQANLAIMPARPIPHRNRVLQTPEPEPEAPAPQSFLNRYSGYFRVTGLIGGLGLIASGSYFMAESNRFNGPPGAKATFFGNVGENILSGFMLSVGVFSTGVAALSGRGEAVRQIATGLQRRLFPPNANARIREAGDTVDGGNVELPTVNNRPMPEGVMP